MRSTGFAAIGIAALTAVSIYAIAVEIAVAADGHADPNASAKATVSVVDSKGNLSVPRGYRSTYQYLGCWAVAADQAPGAKELHVVYASPAAIAAYRKRGSFPDGTVLVKEVYAAATGQMTTGTVSHADTLKGWFVMMKDSRGRHPDNKLWGDGWGWSWFDAANPSKTTSTDYKTNCQACHVPAQASDWIYVSGYPSLKP
jgi:hypothetical protein